MEGGIRPSETAEERSGGSGGPGGSLPGQDDREEKRRFGTAIGWLFVGGSLLAIPSTFLFDPRPSEAIYVVFAAALCTGLVILAAPWERLSLRWFHLTALTGTVLITLAVELGGRGYGFLYVLVVVGSAFVFKSRAEVAVQVALVGAALVLPLIWEPESDREIVQNALLIVPSLALVAASIVYLRERLDRTHRRHLEFAEEALALTLRIRGREAGAEGGASTPPGRRPA
jgi:hypothetical protein